VLFESHPSSMSYVGVVLSTIGGDCQPSSQDLQATLAHESAVITLNWTACQRKRCCRRPGHHSGPRVPNPPDEAIPSHPQPTMEGTSTPTPTPPTLSVRANNLPCLEMSLAPPPSMPLSSPSLLPFTLVSSDSTNLGGGIHSILPRPCVIGR
jgi:hypothetical protein